MIRYFLVNLFLVFTFFKVYFDLKKTFAGEKGIIKGFLFQRFFTCKKHLQVCFKIIIDLNCKF
jgi:hypothetical protein